MVRPRRSSAARRAGMAAAVTAVAAGAGGDGARDAEGGEYFKPRVEFEPRNPNLSLAIRFETLIQDKTYFRTFQALKV